METCNSNCVRLWGLPRGKCPVHVAYWHRPTNGFSVWALKELGSIRLFFKHKRDDSPSVPRHACENFKAQNRRRERRTINHVSIMSCLWVEAVNDVKSWTSGMRAVRLTNLIEVWGDIRGKRKIHRECLCKVNCPDGNKRRIYPVKDVLMLLLLWRSTKNSIAQGNHLTTSPN